MAGRLEYGGVGSQFGVIVEERSDGGVRVTIPLRVLGAASQGEGVMEKLRQTASWLKSGGVTQRAEIEITPQTVTIVDYSLKSAESPNEFTQTLPRAEVTELRANRYSPGLYVRMAGKANFDMCCDLDPRLLEWLGGILEAAMARTARQA